MKYVNMLKLYLARFLNIYVGLGMERTDKVKSHRLNVDENPIAKNVNTISIDESKKSLILSF